MAEANVGYAFAELERALIAATSHASDEVRERARARVSAWRSVMDGMTSGALCVGSRTPTAAPAWATLEVVKGGFATGALVAEGPMLQHESELGTALGNSAGDRRELALALLSDAGRALLREMLASGRYRIDVPEEGALLAAAALLDRDAAEAVGGILDAITPFFDRIRFAPRPTDRAATAVATVHVETVGVTRARVAAMQTPLDIQRQREALSVWAPLTDRAIDLLIETVVDGVPGRTVPDEWPVRARALIDAHAHARQTHRLCTRPHKPGENLAIAIRALEALSSGNGSLSPRELGLVKVAIAGHTKKHGAPGADRRTAHRAAGARVACLPTRSDSASVVTDRLATYPADATLGSVDAVAAPFADGPHAGVALFPSVVAKLERCVDSSIEDLVARGVLTSGEAIARVLPQVSAHVRALGFADPQIARLYAAIDAAFRRRRSLLLLDFQSQVRLDELPWVAPLEPLRADDGTSRDGARRLLTQVCSIAIDAFPYAIVPNPLIEELRALATRASVEIPFVDELAADIFMGGFTAKFVRAAALVARRLNGTLYARYYALPIDQILAMDAGLSSESKGPVPPFGELCERRAEVAGADRWSVARNGMIIEQQQILTTQNLLPLVELANFGAPALEELASRSFDWMLDRLGRRSPSPIDRLRTVKNVAYAWRQVIVYLSVGDPAAVARFTATARSKVVARPGAIRRGFERAIDGLAAAGEGHTPEDRFVGWTRDRRTFFDEM